MRCLYATFSLYC